MNLLLVSLIACSSGHLPQEQPQVRDFQNKGEKLGDGCPSVVTAPLNLPAASSQAEAFDRVRSSFESLYILRRESTELPFGFKNFGSTCHANAALQVLLHATTREPLPSRVREELHALRLKGLFASRWALARLVFIHLTVFQSATEFLNVGNGLYNDYNVWAADDPVYYMDAVMTMLGMNGPATPPFQSLTTLFSHVPLCDAFVPHGQQYFGVIVQGRVLPLVTHCYGYRLSLSGVTLNLGGHYTALVRDQSWMIYDDLIVHGVTEQDAEEKMRRQARVAIYNVTPE